MSPAQPARTQRVMDETRLVPSSRALTCCADMSPWSGRRLWICPRNPWKKLCLPNLYRKSRERRAPLWPRERGLMRSATTLITVSTRSRRPETTTAGLDRATLR